MINRDFTKEEDWVWLAAIIDGEGWIGIRNDSRRPHLPGLPGLTLHMTDKDIVDAVAVAFQCNVTQPLNRQKEHHKENWSAQITGKKVIPVLLKILPYMSYRRTFKINEVISLYKERATTIPKGSTPKWVEAHSTISSDDIV